MNKKNLRKKYALSNIEAGSQRYNEDLQRYNDYYGPTQVYLRENPNAEVNLQNKSSKRNIFEDYSNAQTLDSEKTWIEKTGEGVIDFAADRTNDLLNVGRMWTNKLIDQFIDGDLSKIDTANQEKSDLIKIKDYYSLVQQLNELKSRPLFDDRGFKIDSDTQQQQIKELEEKIQDYDSYFTGEGRTHDIIAKLMFDPNNMDAIDSGYMNSLYVGRKLDRKNYIDGSITGFLKQQGVNITNILSEAEGGLDWAITTGQQLISNALGQGKYINGYKTKEVVKTLDPNNVSQRYLLEKLYKGSRTNINNVDTDSNIQDAQNRIDQQDRYINQLTAELKSDVQFSKDGKLFGIDIYDPEDIPQQFKDEQQKFGSSFWEYLNTYKALIYSAPETASTVGIMHNQIYAMGINGLLGYISHELPTWAIGPGKVGKGLRLVEKNLPGLINTSMEATAVGSGILAAKQSRVEETGLEAISALGARVSAEVQNNGGDVQKIVNAVHEKSARMGIDTSDWDLDKIIKFAICYNIDTGDSAFDEAKTEARKGVNKLINANNALAIVDYLQALPFMSYSGSAMKSWATGAFERNVGGYRTIMPGIGTVEKSKPIMQAVSDATIGKAANKFIKDGAVKKGLFIKHSGEYALKKVPLIVGESFSEGLEEINQELLQSKYQRGLYDDYNRVPNMLDFNEIFDNNNLAFEGIAAYAGITPWDPYLSVEDVRKAFHIGAASSALFAGSLRAASNLAPTDQHNMRNLILQLKNDKYVANIVANYYNQVQDQKHLELFFDAFTKAGVDRSRLQKSLSDLRDAVDEKNTLVRKDYIDSDIRLMNAAWSIFNNDKINESLKENGIEKYSDIHKQLVVDGAVAIVEEQKNQEKIQEGAKKISDIQNEHVDIVSQMLDKMAAPERIKQLEQEYPELANIVVKLKQDYEVYRANRESSLLGKFGAFSRSFDSVKKFTEDEGVQDYIRKHGLSEETVEKENEEEYNPLELEARRIFANNKERKSALRHAFEYQNKKRYSQILQDERNFSRNKYIRQYARNQVSAERDLDSKLYELYNDKQKREQAISKAFESYNNGTYSVNDYIIERIHLLHNHQKLQRLQYARDVAADKNRRNMEIRKHTGLDTYTGLEGIVEALDREIEHYKKIEDRQLNGTNTSLKQKLTWADLFKGKDFKFDDQQEFDQEFSTLALNRAINGPQRVLAAAYLVGYSNPISLHDAVFGEQSTSDALADIKKQYEELSAKEQLNYDQDSDVASIGDIATIQHDKQQLTKKAAWAIIKKRLDENLKRRRIANRLYEEEGPITPGYTEEKQKEEENVAERIATGDEKLSEENNDNKANIRQEAPMSDAEKRLNKKYNHQKGETKTIQERIEERRKRRQQSIVEDGLEESEEEVPVVDDGGEQEVEISEEPVNEPKPETPVSRRAAAVVEDSMETPDEEAPEQEPEEKEVKEPKEKSPKDNEDQDDDIEFAPEEPFDLNDGEENDTEFIPEEINEDAEQSIRDAEAAAAEFEEEAETNAAVLENGWVLIDDYSGLEFNDEGFLMYNGEILPPEQQQVVMDDILLLGLSEQLGFSQEELPDGVKKSSEDSRLTATNDQLTNLISQTFFYQPDPKKNEETGEDELPKLTVNGKQVKFDKPLASGRELSKKLSQNGWLNGTKKYFIVTQSEQGKNVAKDKDIRDAMTIALVIEDTNNSYLTFLRPLGLTESEGYGPHGSIMVNSETAIRNWLLSRHVDWRSVLKTIGDEQYTYNDGQIIKKGSKYPLTSSQKVALYQQAVAKIAIDRARQGYYANTGSYDGFEHWYTNDPIRSDFKNDESWQKAVAERKRMRKLYTDRARQSLAHAGKTILSEEQVDKQINDLRAFRNRIIDAYLIKETKNGKTTYKFPTTIKKSVTPIKVVQSNGKINNQKDKFKNPIYRTIGKQNSTIEEIQQELESGEITLGYGLGMFANDQDRFAIRGLLDSQATVQFNGRGLSGKIYWMVKGPAGAQTRIPIMLAEEKFDTQVQIVDGKQRTVYLNNPNNLVLCLKRDPRTGKFENVNTNGYQPSAAEIIFYMLINQMNVGLDAERHAEMVEFFIHSGEKTLLKNQPKSGSDPFNVLGRKQLAFHTVDDQQVLTVGLKDTNGKYVARSFTVEQMMLQSEEGEVLRRQIVNAIATQMHWNTDLSHMNSSINVLGTSNTSVAQLFRWAIDNFAEDFDDVNKYLDQRVSIFGCPQLSFRIGDFFDKKGDDIVPKTDVSVLAWMIKENKIKTDVGEQPFTAPFVFANGVQIEGGEVETETSKVIEEAGENDNSPTVNVTTPPKAPKKAQKKTKPAEVTTFNLSDENVYNEMVSEWRPGLEERRKKEGWFVAKTEDDRQKVRESINQTKDAKDNGGINDRIMIRAPREKIAQDKAVDAFKKVLKEFLDKYNKQYPDNAVDPNNVNINELTEDQIKTQWALKRGYIILDLYKNKKAKVQVRKDADFGNWRNPVTGVFSKTIGGQGTFKFEKARKWLAQTLGIDPDNVVLTNAVMRSTTNESVYGLTNVALDRIAGEVTGYMKFSEYADEGIEYHEAWHYVNLLMHDKETRGRIYESYIKSHKSLNRPGIKIKDVEEAMADDFKVYMEGFVDKSISGKIRRLFSNVLDFLIASRRKSEYRIVFKAIANGEYAAAKLDKASISEFQNRYKQGVASISYSIPGLSKTELDKMTNVRTYQDIFDGTNAIINRVFAVLDLTSPKKMQAVANSGFGKVLQIVDDMIGEQSDENKIAKLQDIRQNERFLRKALIDAFMELGIVAKVRKSADVQKTERTEINEDALKKENEPDNTWDKFTLTSQRKENASLNTKMFLRQIPIYQKQYLDDGTIQYNLDRDDYGTVKMYDSDQAWRKIIDTLWMCDSYSEIDENGKYSPTSIMGIVDAHRNVDPFFYSLFMKLQDLDLSGEFGDIQLKSQILSTVNSSKTQVQLIVIQNPREAKVSTEDDLFGMSDEEYDTFDDNGVVADKRREWILRNDSLISVARNLPRKWSKNLASNGLLGFNGTKSESVVDRNFVQKIEKDLNSIQKTISKYTSVKKTGFVPKSSEQLQSILDQLKPQIIEFYNKLGIESDTPSLNVYIALMSGINGELTPQQQIDSLQKIFNTSVVGSISYIIDGLVQNVGNTEVTPSGSKYTRSIDEAFSEYAADSHIGVLALAWSAVHPSSQEFSVKDANNNRLYPINLNNYISDRVRAMNNRRSGYIRKMQRSSYCQHSIIADAANAVKASDPKSKIKLNTFVGIRDANVSVGADYFGITAAEDYIAKLCMTEDDQIIFPTMADKKTWNSLSSENIKLTHDTMLISPLDRDIKKYIYQEYTLVNPYNESKYTSKGSWEFEARKWYRSLDQTDETRKNIIKNAAFDLGAKRSSSVGFDLDIDNGYVGARFSDTTLNRFAGYFLDELNAVIDYYNKESIANLVKDKNRRIENYHGKIEDGRMDFSGNGGKFRYLYDIPFPEMQYNLNQMLEGLFELQKKIESGQTLNRAKKEGDIAPYIGTDVLNVKNPDGFELIREYLKDLKKTYFKKGGIAKPELLNAINKKLVDQTEEELFRISRPGSSLQLAEYNSRTGFYTPKGIPEQLLNRYTKILQEANYGNFGKAYDSEDLLHHALFSLIGSYVANTATSVIEVEKIFSGDPAFYKKKALKNKSKIIINHTFSTGEVAKEEVEVENLDDVYSDKIKRLGGTLSPGQELRLDFTDEELEFDPTLKCTKYTNLNVEDIKIPSLFLDELEDRFRRQLVVDMIRSNTPKGFSSFLTKLQNERNKNNARLKEEGKKTRGEITVENAIDKIYSDKKIFDSMWEYLTDTERMQIETDLEQQMRPYEKITVADAQVFIRPALYRKIRISLGQWSFEPDENGYSDEEAYNILEGITVNEDGTRTKNPNPSDDWVRNAELYQKVKKLQLFPLKMSYFQNDEERVTDDISINRPIYNKMAIFPLFAFQRSTSVGRDLYDRMNRKGNELDMISFKSAVKVGAIQKGADVVEQNNVENAMSALNKELNQQSSVHLDYTTGEEISAGKSKSCIGVTVQDLHNLRMQLNTQAHDAELRAIGTQMFKIAFSNIIDDAFYGTGKSGRKVRKGSAIKRDIISCINALTRIGIDDIRDRFYKDGHLDNKAVQEFVETVVRNNGLGSSAEEIIANGGTAAGIISRTVFENSASSIVNSDIIDINTKGGTAIQQSVYGFVGYGSGSVGTLSYNSGRELKWSASEGSMQVILSMNFFKSVIPDYNNKTYEQCKEWLVKHNIIGDNSKPFGVGYRIPTQGMSSMFAFQVADVLPEQVGDLIIVPREFTAQTGSDFDVDKLYLATMSYKDGVLEWLSNDAFSNRGRSFEESIEVAEDRQLARGVKDDEIDVTKWLQDASNIENEDIRGAIANRLLLNYIDIISDERNYADARGSIDVITNMLHDQLLDPVLKKKSAEYIPGMLELLPSFQELRKMEFGVGKSGIGPFALNITNLALTQYTHLTINFGNIGDEYGFRPLDKIEGRDGRRISSWLSAMVNAHVDVAKDPYVFDLNVNQATYNHANLLIRCGMGLSTFTFLAQPALKDYADTINNAGGLYGDNLEGDTPMSEEFRSRKNAIYKRKVNYYRRKLDGLVKKYEEFISTPVLIKAKQAIEYYEYVTASYKDRREAGYTDKNKPSRPLSRGEMFSETDGKRAILHYKTGADINENNINDVINSIIYQLSALESFNEIDQFAQQLSQLVQCSQIDTKKFGNTIHEQINFTNKYDAFRLNSTLFTINDQEFLSKLTPKDEKKGLTPNEISTAALDKYFNELYLNMKLRAATRYTREIISRQLFSATDTYESLFKNILGIINGFDERTDVNGMPNAGYKQLYNTQSIDSFAEGIDNMMRFNSFMNLGPSIYKNAVAKYGSTTMIDFTMGGDINTVVNKFKQITIGSKEQKSVFVRLAKLISQIKKDPYSDKADGLVDADGDITNDLLLYLNPQTPNDKYPIGRMLLQHSQTENKSSEERRLISAFAQLLEHPNEEVRELARDIAFYAYFSTYDQNTANSFFHLVPYEYRKQYDLALLNSLESLSSKKPQIKAQAIRNIGGLNISQGLSLDDVEMSAAANMIDVLSRNYWFDDNLVPVHYITSSQAENRFQSSAFGDTQEEFTGPSIYDAASGRTFPTYIATTRVKNNSMYIKIRKGSGTFLYKRVGAVNRFYTDKKGNQKSSNSYYIYVAIPKAGIHVNGINQFELYADYNTPSIFDENRLERDYAEDLVRKDVEELVNDQKDGYYQLELSWDNESVPALYTSSNTTTYREDTIVNPDKRKVNGVTVYNKKDPEKIGQKNADVIIDITNNKTTGDVERPNIKQDYKDKVVELSLDGNIQKVVKAIQKIKDKDIKIHITTPLFDGQFDVSDKEYENYIKEQLNLYSLQLGSDVQDVESLLKTKEDSLRNNKWTKRNIAQQKINDLLHDLTQQLILAGITITRYSSAAKEGKTQLSVAVAYVKSIDGTYLDSDKNTVFVDKELSANKKKFRGLLSQLDYTPKQIQSESSEDQAIVKIPEEKLTTSTTKVEEFVANQPKSKFAVGNTEELEFEEQMEEEIPEIIKEAQNKEKNKDEAKHTECSGAGKNKFAKGVDILIIEE